MFLRHEFPFVDAGGGATGVRLPLLRTRGGKSDTTPYFDGQGRREGDTTPYFEDRGKGQSDKTPYFVYWGEEMGTTPNFENWGIKMVGKTPYFVRENKKGFKFPF